MSGSPPPAGPCRAPGPHQGEEEPGVSPVDDLVAAKLHEVRELGFAVHHQTVHLELELSLLVVIQRHVVLGQPGLPLAVL